MFEFNTNCKQTFISMLCVTYLYNITLLTVITEKFNEVLTAEVKNNVILLCGTLDKEGPLKAPNNLED